MNTILLVLGILCLVSMIIGYFAIKNALYYDEDEKRFIPKSEETEWLKKQNEK